jgi:selenide,water dikinase
MEDPNLLVGVHTGDDAAVYRLGDDIAIVQSVDFFPPIVDDPYQFGTIAAANAFSDLYAMGARPLLALNLVCFPIDLDKTILGEILRGGHDKTHEAGAVIGGGHTIDDAEPKYGLSVTGVVRPGEQVTNSGARPGDTLVLTKPIGTGIITTAGKDDATDPATVQGAIEFMATLNRAASEAMLEVGVNACTDITGFGLLGHLSGMAAASGVSARVSLAAVPVIPGARELVESGVAPGGTHRNLKSLDPLIAWAPDISEPAKLLLCDAQTSGGLLFSLPQDRVPALLSALEKRGVTGVLVGQITEAREKRIEVGA